MPQELANFGIGTLAHVEHKIEPRDEPIAGLGHSHHQFAAEQSVAAVHRLVWKIELGGEHALLRRLQLDVIVAGAAGIERRQDGAQAVAALGIGEQMPAIAKAGVVVLAALVGMPEVEERLRDRPAGARQNLPAELNPARRAAMLDELGAQRRTGLEIRPLGLPHGRLIAVVALRRRCKRLRERIIERKSGRGERAQHSAARGMKLHDGLLVCEPAPFAILPAVACRRASRARQRTPVSCPIRAGLRPITPRSIARPSLARASPPPRALRAQAFARRGRAALRWYWARAADRRMDSCRSQLRDWPWRSRRAGSRCRPRARSRARSATECERRF